MKKKSFSISVRWVFADNGVLTHLLNFLGEKYVSIAVDMRLGNRDYPDWEDKGAYYDPMLLTIFFHQGDISPVCIQEEFLHYVQHNIYHYDMTAEYKRSIEFEVAMMIDIVNAIDTRRVPEKLYVDLENGMGDYRNMLQSFAERWCWSKDSVIEKFGEWMDDWKSDYPKGRVHSPMLLDWLYKLLTGVIS